MKKSLLKRKTEPDPKAQIKAAYREARRSLKPRRNKYGAIKTWESGIRHDSKLEAGHARELRSAQMLGLIKGLEFQKDFTLTVNEKQICTYIADFFYFHIGNNKWTIADSKGKETAVFKLKWKLIKALYPDNDFVLFKKAWIEL